MTNGNGARRTAQGPGRRLHEARVKARLSPEQVAELLHLSTQQIEAIENDDYEKLPGPTYVRGYLRSYSQLLGLPAREIVESYARQNGAGKSPSLGRLVPERESTTRDTPVRLAAVLVFGVFLLLAVVWWQGRNGSPPPLGNEPTELPAQTMPAAPSRDARSATPALRQETAGDVEIDQAAPSHGGADPLAPSAAPPPLAAAKPLSEPAALAPPGLAGASELTLSTREECWVDIRDAREEKLVYALVPAGRRLTVSGVAPFTVFLGNPDGVVLTYQQNTIEASRYKRGLVARFTVGTGRSGP